MCLIITLIKCCRNLTLIYTTQPTVQLLLLPVIKPEITHPIDNIDDLLMFYVHKFKIISENYGKDCQLSFKIQYFSFFNKRTSEFQLSTSLSRTKTTFSSFCLVFQLGGHVTECSPKGISENYWHYFQLMPLKWLMCVCALLPLLFPLLLGCGLDGRS